MDHTQRLFAPAKINLFLHITGRRPDGFHTLQSLMVFADVGDDIEISPHSSMVIEVCGPFGASMPFQKDNLIYKAAMMLAQHYKVPPVGRVVLTKKLPIASGIGGGSANAAAALKGFVKLWALPDEPVVLADMAARLGSDVPACLYQKTTLAEGVGEKLTKLPPLPEMHFVLINPRIEAQTAQVFSRYEGHFSKPISLAGKWPPKLEDYRNDLTAAAINVTPAIKEVLAALAETTNCQLQRVSGSGATCFGLYPTAEAAEKAANDLQQKYPGWWVKKAGLLK